MLSKIIWGLINNSNGSRRKNSIDLPGPVRKEIKFQFQSDRKPDRKFTAKCPVKPFEMHLTNTSNIEHEDAKNAPSDNYVKGYAKDTFDQVDERTKPKGNDRDDGRER